MVLQDKGERIFTFSTLASIILLAFFHSIISPFLEITFELEGALISSKQLLPTILRRKS